MNRSSLRWLAGAALSGLAATALVAPTTASAAPAPAAFCADGSQPMVTQDEVIEEFDQTTTVTGLTVVQGTTPVEFTGTYAGYIPNALGKGVAMLLFRMEGAGIDAATNATGRAAGIWAGMSGSPVYTDDDRLIGAVAYGLSPDDIPLAGVTPADYMKAVGTDKLTPKAPAAVRVAAKNLEGSRRTVQAAAGQSLQHLKTVKVITGGARANALANRTQARVPKNSSPAAKAVRAGGFSAVGAPTRIAQPIVPGGNIAVGYSTGDLFSGGVGTVTAVCGDDVWAFGHPMDFWGQTALSIHNASAALIVTDSTGLSGSYKQVATVGQQVGTITEDGYGAIRGKLGLIKGFPSVTKVVNAKGQVLDTYRGSVVDPDLATNAAMGPALAVYDILDNVGFGTARLSWKIDYRLASGKKGSLRNWQLYYGQADLADQVAGDIGNDIASIAYTDLADATITSVTSTLTLLDRKPIGYRFVGAQVWTGKNWVKLNGRTLKKHRTHVVRPVYRQYVNGKPRATSFGPNSKFKMGKLAAGRGSVTYSRKGEVAEFECFEDEDGDFYCPDFEGDEEPRTFTALIEAIDALIPANRGQGVTEWKWKSGKKSKGSKTRTSGLVAPGVIDGSYKATFRIAR